MLRSWWSDQWCYNSRWLWCSQLGVGYWIVSVLEAGWPEKSQEGVCVFVIGPGVLTSHKHMCMGGKECIHVHSQAAERQSLHTVHVILCIWSCTNTRLGEFWKMMIIFWDYSLLNCQISYLLSLVQIFHCFIVDSRRHLSIKVSSTVTSLTHFSVSLWPGEVLEMKFLIDNAEHFSLLIQL